MTWPRNRHQDIKTLHFKAQKHHHHGTAEGSFTAKKWFGHRAGRSPCAHSIGKFFLWLIVFFLWNFRPRLVRALLVYKLGIWTCNLQWMGPQVTCAHQKEPLAPKIHCLDLNKQPFRLGTGGDRGFRGGDRGLGTYTWRCSTMNKQPLGWELGGTGVLGVGTGDWGLIHGDVVQWTNNHLGWELGGLGF